MMKQNHQSGFTLIELSIVLVIVGLIVGGVLVGRDLIKAAELRKQVSQLNEYTTAANTFMIKYGSLPGDVPYATRVEIGLPSPNGFGPSLDALCGMGDGKIDGVCGQVAGNVLWVWPKVANFFTGLSAFQFISGGYVYANFNVPMTFGPGGDLPVSPLYGDTGVAAYSSTDNLGFFIGFNQVQTAGPAHTFSLMNKTLRNQVETRKKALISGVSTIRRSKLDCLARSTRDLLDIADAIAKVGAGLKSLSEPWADTTSPAGRMVLTVFAGIAEFERELIRERTGTGRIAAMKRGVRFGRPASLNSERADLARRLLAEGKSAKEVAATFGVNRSTIYRATASAEQALRLHHEECA